MLDNLSSLTYILIVDAIHGPRLGAFRGGETKMTNHPNRSASYTVLNRHGDIQCEGESLSGAAKIVMGYDGHEFEIRTSDGGFDLWTSVASRNGSAWNGLTKSVIYSQHADADLAAADIYRQVIRNSEWWSGCEVLTDVEYAARLAEIADGE